VSHTGESSPIYKWSKNAPLTPSGDDWWRSFDERTRHAAASGSERLKLAIEKMFWKFALKNKLDMATARRLQLDGHRP
jgi:hypothetical protein